MCGCAARRGIMVKAAQNILRGKGISAQVTQFNNTVRKDVQAVKRVVSPRFTRTR